MVNKTVGIVGSGIAGLMCGQLLKEAGHLIFLVDKGRRPGGRMSTRNRDPWQWDHGAQYFTVRDQRFAASINAWKENGVVSEWFDSFSGQSPEEKEGRYIGVNGMNTIPNYLSSGLNVYQSMCVDKIGYKKSTWHLVMKTGEVFTCEELVLTPPLPQVVNLLKESGMIASISEGNRLIKQGGIKINSEKVLDSKLEIDKGTQNIYQVGKRKFLKIKV